VNSAMKNKTHTTAIVVIPPEDLWHPIQSIRRKHDSKVSRWMPHITLIYPFVPESGFGLAAEELAPVCKAIRPFDVELATFGVFNHGKGYHTIWLAPESEGPLGDLHAEVWTAVSWQDAFEPGIGRFEPHLSVGRTRGTVNTVKLLEELQANWTPIRFPVLAVHLVSRGSRPDDAFRIVKSLPLQGVPSAS
jgi:2'-5' RNA ligase